MPPRPEVIDIIYGTIMAELMQRCESAEALIADSALPEFSTVGKESEARRKFVDILCREGELPRWPEAKGNLLTNLARRGAFRRGGVLLEGPLLIAYAGYFCVTLPQIPTTHEEAIAIGFPGVASSRDLGDSAIAFEEAAETREGPVNADAKVYRLTKDSTQRYLVRQMSVFSPDIIRYLLEESVRSVLLYQAGSIIRLPSPERRLVAHLINLHDQHSIPEIDWLLEAVTLRREQANVAMALQSAVEQRSDWQYDIQRSVAALPPALCAKLIEMCRVGGAALGYEQYVLAILGASNA